MKILVVGGSGGIGKAIVKIFSSRYPEAKIYASYFNHEPDFTVQNLQWISLDATDQFEVEKLSNALGPIDILVNAIGILHAGDQQPEKTLRRFEVQFFEKNLRINTLSSILLAKYFEGNLRSNKMTYFISLSAKVGSISDNQMGGWLSYRVSKAALNMAMKTIAIEWRRRLPKCCVLMFHPGTTDTHLSKPFQTNLPKGQLHSADLTAESLMDIISTATPEASGKFMSFKGSELPW